MRLNGKNVVITGGSQGIGEALADAFSGTGANVLLVARSEEKLKRIAQRIGGEYIVADLTMSADVDSLVGRCVETLGTIDVFINNAGVETDDAFVNTSVDDLRRLARLNFEAPLVLTRNVVRHMMENGEGHVVQMSSLSAAIPFPGLTAYAGSKAGLTQFTESLRREIQGTGVGLTVVSPGPVDTAMWDRLDTGKGYSEPALNRFRKLLFLPKVSPQKIAAGTVKAVEENKRFVRIPARFNNYHWLNNAPRRALDLALTGVDLTPTLRPDAEQ